MPEPKLPPLPTTVAAFTKAIQDYMLRTDPRTGELVTSAEQAAQLGLTYSGTFVFPNVQNDPRQTLALLRYYDRLDVKTLTILQESTAKEFTGIALALLNPILQPFVDLGFFDDTGGTRANLVSALAKWQKRKEVYREVATKWKDAADGDWFKSAPEHTAYGVEVSAPLYLGWYPDAPQQTTLDAVTPMIVANMVGVAQAAKEQAWQELLGDLTFGAYGGGGGVDKWPWWAPWLAGGVGVTAVLGLGGIAYLSLRRPRSSATRGRDLAPPGNPHPVCGDVYGPLTTAERDAMAPSTFGLPAEKKYPMPDSSHAKNAKARAAQQLTVWNKTNGVKGISPRTYRRIADKADRIIEQCAT